MAKPLIKVGEAISFDMNKDIHSYDNILSDPKLQILLAEDSEILKEFQKTADSLKKIAPKAKDFLYFSAIMMHAAEAALLQPDGSLKKDSSGSDVKAHWEKKGESWKWICSVSDIKPYKNSNNDIFPEEELIKAHKKWIGKPLCLDHKSSSVDFTRGVIIDTIYDRKNKRVIALCALDKLNYADLARKVSTGYANNVSMGTAVGRAICTDCGTVARAEHDFCDHMRRKSCYGEINVDLNPIELSIVVNGADPGAKIRHIVAAANSLAQYLEQRSDQISKIAEDETRDIELCDEIENGLGQIDNLLSDLRTKIRQLKGNEETEQKKSETTESVKDTGDADDVTAEVSKPEDVVLKNANSTLENIQKHVEQLNNKFDRLSYNEDNKMTKKEGYFQGAGGVNEPTPGKPKYEKEDADSIRNTKDTHMNSAVDTGPVDGLFPGDEQKKRELLRLAEIERREKVRLGAVALAKAALKNDNSLSKESYFQGAGGVNEPTPKKPKYEKEDAEKVRLKDDTHMYAPGVGKLDGLYDKDLDTKKKLLRAKLKAQFLKAASPDGSFNQGESCWQVFADGNLILRATVNEIRKANPKTTFDTIATTQFAKNIISSIKSEGFDKTVSFLKGAQAAAPLPVPADPMGGLPPAGDAPGGEAPGGEAPVGEEPAVDEGNSGDPKEQLDGIAQDISNLSAQLLEVSDALNNKSDDLGSFEELAQNPAALAEVKASASMQKKLAESLSGGIKVVLENLADTKDEVKLASQAVSNLRFAKSTDKREILSHVKDTCSEALETIASGKILLRAFVNYARGTENFQKRAKEAFKMKKKAQVTMPEETIKPTPSMPVAPKVHTLEQGGSPTASSVKVYEGATPKSKEQVMKEQMEGMMPDLVNDTANPPPAPPVKLHDALRQQYGDTAKADDKDESEKDSNDLKAMPDGSMEGSPEEVGKALKEKTTAQSKAERRVALAQKAVQWSDMLQKAHGGGGATTQLDVKPTGDLAKVETLPEVHQKMLDVANAPPKVRKLAEDIQRNVLAGHINPETDFDNLIAVGLDSQAVSYWKKYFAQAPNGGSEFASELTKAAAEKKVAEEKAAHFAKITRAYELAQDMANAELIEKSNEAIKVQAASIMEFNDASFEHLKKIVTRQTKKTASAMPQIGLIGGGDVYLPAPEAASDSNDVKSRFDKYFAGKKF